MNSLIWDAGTLKIGLSSRVISRILSLFFDLVFANLNKSKNTDSCMKNLATYCLMDQHYAQISEAEGVEAISASLSHTIILHIFRHNGPIKRIYRITHSTEINASCSKTQESLFSVLLQNSARLPQRDFLSKEIDQN